MLYRARQVQVLFVLSLRLEQMTCPQFCLYKKELIVIVFHRALEQLNESVSVMCSTLLEKPGSILITIISLFGVGDVSGSFVCSCYTDNTWEPATIKDHEK